MKPKTLFDKIITFWWIFCCVAGIAIGFPLSVYFDTWYLILLQLVPLCVSFFSFLIHSMHSCQDRVWLVRLVCSLSRNLTPVELYSYRAEKTYSVAKIDQDGLLHAYCCWFYEIGDCILLPNGHISENSDVSYQFFWMPLRRNERVEFILRNDLPDFAQIAQLPKAERCRLMSQYKDKQ